jgi:hypothetical protein
VLKVEVVEAKEEESKEEKSIEIIDCYVYYDIQAIPTLENFF